MQNTDWIVVGGGLSGSALAYELARCGFSVRLLDKQAAADSATRFSYGGLAYWSAQSEPMRSLCQESQARYPMLSAELGSDIQFRPIDLLLTIAPDHPVSPLVEHYQRCLVPPQLLSVEAACEREPLLHPAAIAGALLAQHGHVHPERTMAAYRQAMQRLGGTVAVEKVTGFVQQGDRISGVTTPTATYAAQNVVVCAGAWSRALLRSLGHSIRMYYTWAELIETPPLNLQLQTMLMPADLKRFEMEAIAAQDHTDALWDEPNHELTEPIFDLGMIQFLDGHLRLGQISRALTSLQPQVDAAASETQMRQNAYAMIPALQDMPGRWQGCLVAFTGDRLPLVGAVDELEGLHVFTGFSNPFAILPPLAQRFAHFVAGNADDIIPQFSPNRFSSYSRLQ